MCNMQVNDHPDFSKWCNTLNKWCVFLLFCKKGLQFHRKIFLHSEIKSTLNRQQKNKA